MMNNSKTGNERYWLVAPGNNKSNGKYLFWNVFLQDSVIRVGGWGLPDDDEYNFKNLIHQGKLDSKCEEYGAKGAHIQIINFAEEMKVGDWVIAKRGIKKYWVTEK